MAYPAAVSNKTSILAAKCVRSLSWEPPGTSRSHHAAALHSEEHTRREGENCYVATSAQRVSPESEKNLSFFLIDISDDFESIPCI